jgi:hypothetical protein
MSVHGGASNAGGRRTLVEQQGDHTGDIAARSGAMIGELDKLEFHLKDVSCYIIQGALETSRA